MRQSFSSGELKVFESFAHMIFAAYSRGFGSRYNIAIEGLMTKSQ